MMNVQAVLLKQPRPNTLRTLFNLSQHLTNFHMNSTKQFKERTSLEDMGATTCIKKSLRSPRSSSEVRQSKDFEV